MIPHYLLRLKIAKKMAYDRARAELIVKEVLGMGSSPGDVSEEHVM